MTRRQWSVEQKMAIVLEGLKGEGNVAELCRRHQITQAQYYRWRDQFLSGGEESLRNGKTDKDAEIEGLRRQVEKLEQLAGRQQFMINELKKTKLTGL